MTNRTRCTLCGYPVLNGTHIAPKHLVCANMCSGADYLPLDPALKPTAEEWDQIKETDLRTFDVPDGENEE